MSRRTPRRMMAISASMVIITATAFTRLTGIEGLRPIHIATLLACGMSIGAFITNLVIVIKSRDN